MEKSAVVEHVWEHHHPIPLGGDHRTGPWQWTGVVGEGSEALHIQMTPVEERFNRDGGLECDEEAGREEQSSPTFDLQ